MDAHVDCPRTSRDRQVPVMPLNVSQGVNRRHGAPYESYECKSRDIRCRIPLSTSAALTRTAKWREFHRRRTAPNRNALLRRKSRPFHLTAAAMAAWAMRPSALTRVFDDDLCGCRSLPTVCISLDTRRSDARSDMCERKMGDGQSIHATACRRRAPSTMCAAPLPVASIAGGKSTCTKTI